MGLFNKNTTVDTPFDNYKERQEEQQRLLVNHVPESPVYMSQEAVIFMVSVVMAVFQKCTEIKSGIIWVLATVAVVFLWSVTIRFILPKKNMLVHVFANTMYVLIMNAGIVIGLYYLLKMEVKPTDYFLLIPLALGFSILSYGFHSDDYFDYQEDILWPTVRTTITMLLVTTICHFIGITQHFVVIVFAGIILLLMSKLLSKLNKREYLFSPVPAYSIFRSIPNRNTVAFVRFFLYRALLFVVLMATAIICLIVCRVALNYGFDVSMFSTFIVVIILSIVVVIIDFIPFFKEETKSKSRTARIMKYIEIPLLSAFMAIPVINNYEHIKFGVYVLFLVALEVLFSGLVIALPRRLLFTRRVKVSSGAPAMLIALALIDMVVELLFVIY